MIQLTDATILVNDEAVPIIPNSASFDEGLGEQQIRAASIGGGKVEQIFSNDIESNFGNVMFDMPTTPETVKLALEWKTQQNRNTVQIAGSTTEGSMTRTFTQAAILNNYTVEIGTEGKISIEFVGNPPI